MGFLDYLKKIVDTTESMKKQTYKISGENGAEKKLQQPIKKASAPVSSSKKSTSGSIIESGSVPPKLSVLRRSSCFNGDFKYEMSFMLSGDFIEFNSHCEIDPSYQYEPYSDDNYTEYDGRLPNIGIGPSDQVYDAVDKFLKNGEQTGRCFEEVENKNFLFKTKLEYFGDILYAYAFSDETSWDHDMLGLVYNSDIENTPLEKKLISALDEAAMTYKETRKDHTEHA